jgi:diguanylate cyclase (GGDEF)-like protein
MNQPDISRPVALLIDDDQTVHLWANRYLPVAGFRLISCVNGEEGIKAYNEEVPDIVMVDVEMPIKDGFETCTEIRRLVNGKTIPIVMMTVTEDPERIAKAYASGATDFVIKPLNWNILAQRLQYMVKAHSNFVKLEQSEYRLSKAKQMALLGDWEWTANSDKIYWSDEIYSMLEIDKNEFIPDTKNFQEFIHTADRSCVSFNLTNILKTREAVNLEFRIYNSRNQELTVSQHVEAIVGHDGQLLSLIGTVQDITEYKAQENKIRHLAYYDGVTQLPNRTFFFKFLAKTLELAQRKKNNFGIIFLDLDGFKGINDTYGHLAGDQLLQEISKRLTGRLRCSDLASRFQDDFDQKIDVARLGGDEFIILLNDLSRPEDAATVAERIQSWITEPVILGDRLVYIGASMGIAVYPEDGKDAETLLKNADIAMYHAKKTGKGHYRFFHESMAIKAKKRLEIETYMHHAVANNELRLHYQPVMDIATSKLIGAEALLRWESPQLGFLPPNDFIPLAEDNGLINQFGEWVIREACRQGKVWEQEGYGSLTLAVNLSSLQFNQSSFIPMVSGIIKEFGIDPAFLTFELTESMIMADNENMLTKLNNLKSLGIKLALDDFGTGYSSLRYLNRFPIDTLKIDRSFVKELPDSTDASAIVSAILALAKALNLKTVAEGVETIQQKTFLQNTSCNAVQGYFFSKPMPVAEFQQYWIKNNHTH